MLPYLSYTIYDFKIYLFKFSYFFWLDLDLLRNNVWLRILFCLSIQNQMSGVNLSVFSRSFKWVLASWYHSIWEQLCELHSRDVNRSLNFRNRVGYPVPLDIIPWEVTASLI